MWPGKGERGCGPWRETRGLDRGRGLYSRDMACVAVPYDMKKSDGVRGRIHFFDHTL